MKLEDTIAAAATEASTRGRLESDDPGELPRGTVIGRYLVLGKLGAGAMGVVYAAHDPELDRKVALKLLQAGAGDGPDRVGRARLLREAQALAKLSHPNVVAVHDVGTHGDSVWIAMEFVAGQTLGAWAMQRTRRWPEVLQVLADAARGVAAAHMAGLVHRDLKPDNVMLDGDGRVRVMDFGLAHGRGAATPESEHPSTRPADTMAHAKPVAVAIRLTEVGFVQGTPGYMAPEQWMGQEAEAAADQFGWSVMAWELLYGERPFAGMTLAALATTVLAGRRRPPPKHRSVPGWLRRVVERGLATEPSHRWPTMLALLEMLERGRLRSRVRTGAVVLGGVVALGVAVEGSRRWDIAQRTATCDAMGTDIDAVWNDATRLRLREAFMATGVSYAGTTADKVMPWLDRQAEAWKRARTDACKNADIRGVWDRDILDRSVWCLEDRQMDVGSLVAEFGRANEVTVQKAVSAVASLRASDACLDESLLRRQPSPPALGLEAIRSVRVELSQAQSLRLAGNIKDALKVASQARERAEVLGWPPLLAAARAQEGKLLGKAGAYAEAEAVSVKAYFEAAHSGTWEVAASAATNLVYIVGFSRARPAGGHEWAQHAAVAMSYAGDPVDTWEAARLSSLASVQWAAGAYAEARTLNERALVLYEKALGPDHPDVAACMNNLAIVQYAIGAYEEARALNEQALAIYEKILGPEHPDVATCLTNLASARWAAGAYTQALALNERALAIYEKALGTDHPDVAMSLTNVASVQWATGEYATARALNERALAIYEKALGPDHPDVATSLNNLAAMHEAIGGFNEARALHERALAIREKALGPDHPDVALSLSNLAAVQKATGALAEALRLNERALTIRTNTLGPDHPDVAKSLSNLATLHELTGGFTEARALHERALFIREQALGPDHPDVAMSLSNLAGLYIAGGQPHDALPLLERAVLIFDGQPGVQTAEFETHFNLAKALAATNGDRARAIVEAGKAHAGYQEAGASKSDQLAEVDQWLAAQ